jgi:outer membrane lipase/esterase
MVLHLVPIPMPVSRFSSRVLKALGSFLLLTATLQVGSASAAITSLQKLFVFGDSLSDNGNSGLLTGGAFPPPPYVQNRYSNGPVAVEQLWQLFNPGNSSFQPSLLPGGTNYAIGGSTTGKENNVGVDVPVFVNHGMAWQLNGYTSASPVFDPSTTLFVVSAFPNDVFFNLKTGLSAGTYAGLAGTPLPLNQVPALAATNIRGTINTLLASGARNLLVVSSPDLGKVPAFFGKPQAPIMAQISSDFNGLLEGETAAIAAANPLADIDLFRLDQTMTAVINNPSAHGLVNVTDPCFSTVSMSVCSNPSEYLFWDSLHPTTRGHALIARDMAAVVPGPLPIMGAFSALAWSRRLRQRLHERAL